MLSEKKSWTDYDEAEQEKRADECVEEVVSEYKNGLLLQTERDRYLISRLKRVVRRSVWAITKQMEQGEFQTVTSEFGFEMIEDVLKHLPKEIGVCVTQHDMYRSLTNNEIEYFSSKPYFWHFGAGPKMCFLT